MYLRMIILVVVEGVGGGGNPLRLHMSCEMSLSCCVIALWNHSPMTVICYS